MLKRLLAFGLNHRLVTAAVLAALTLAAGMGLPKLRVDTGFDNLISDTDPHLAAYERISREFGSDDRIIVYVRDPELWDPSKLEILETLHYALEALDFVARVDDLFTLRSIRGAGQSVDARLIMPEAPTDPAVAARARADALYCPLIVGHFLSRDATATALVLTLRPQQAHRSDRQINDLLEQTLAPFADRFEAVFQVGAPRINAELKSVLFADLKRLGPLSAAVLVAAILLFLRSLFAAVVPLVTSGLSIVWTFGLMGWAGIPVNILSAMLPSLVVAIGSTEDTHMIAAYFHGVSRTAEQTRTAATRFMLTHLGVPLMLTLLTTTMGFASNVFSSMGIIRDFAISSTLAIVANGVITILLVPLILATAGPRSPRLFRNREQVGGLPGLFVRLFGITQRRFPRSALVLTALLCGFFVYQLSKLYVTNDPLSYFREDRRLIGEIERIHRDLSGMKVFFVSLSSEADKAFLEPDNVEKLRAIQDFMGKQGIFDSTLSLADHLALIHREFHGGDPEYFTVPRTREQIAQYLLFFHRRDLESYVSHDLRRAAIVVRHNVTDSRMLNRHIAELRHVVADIAGEGMEAHVVGENLMINAAAESLMVAQVKSLAVLLGVIFLIMSAMFTSFKGGFIALVPNLIPIVLMFGVMGYLGVPLNPGTAMVAVIAVGIAIDGTIHLFARYNDLCRRTADYRGAVQETVQAEAVPMVTTSLGLALGFGILLISNFTVIAQFGALSAATMLFALFANLLITPLIMTRIRFVGLYQILALALHKEVLEKSPLFADMSGYQMRKAILISELNEFVEKELLVEQGTTGRSMYLILSGQVEVIRRSDGHAHRVAVLGAGEVFGEIGFIRETQRTADVRALTPVEALRFDYMKIKADLKFFPRIVAKLNYNISCILGERLAEVMGAMDAMVPEAECVRNAPGDGAV